MSGSRNRFAVGKGRRATAVLVTLVLAMVGLGAWGILGARSEAQRELSREFQLEAEGRARAVEATLASLRGDFLFLTQAPPLRDFAALSDDPDPQKRRWSRIDNEASLLLFLEAHPEVERLTVLRRDTPQLVVGRRDGVPTLQAASPSEPAEPAPEGWIRGAWPIDDTTTLVTDVSTTALLRLAVPTASGELALEVAQTDGSTAAEPSRRSVPSDYSADVRAANWTPPLAFRLHFGDPQASRVEGLFRIVGRFRATYALLLLLAGLSLVFAYLAFREARRGAELEAHRRHEAQIHDLERQVFHNERLASVGRLAAGMAHEINNPLEGISSYLSLLGDELEGGDPERAKQFLVRSREGLERVASVTRQVLTYSDPGHAPLETVDLVRSMKETVRFLEAHPLPSTSNIRLEEADSPLLVQGNSVTLGQLFLNLLLNAVEATASLANDGEPAPWEPITVRLAREGDRAVVTVRDAGPGIDPEHLGKLFEPFFSGKGSTGLGLSVCYGIVRDHGGEIAARNHEGGGAVFTVKLPLERNPGAMSASGRKETP
ncbi:MAG: ATP-binding protein [Candidatus Eisenbacteria bacterium]